MATLGGIPKIIYQILKRVKLPSPDVKVPTDSGDPKVIDAGLAQVGEDVGPWFSVRFPHQIGPVLVGISQPVLRLVSVHTTMVPSENTIVEQSNL